MAIPKNKIALNEAHQLARYIAENEGKLIKSAPMYDGGRRVGQKQMYDSGSHFTVMWDGREDIETRSFATEIAADNFYQTI